MYASYGNTQSNSLSITVVSPPSDFTLKLSGPTSVTVNADNLTYTVLVEKNGSPYQYTAEVSLYINGKLYQTSPSDDSGYVYFGPTFSNAGTYKLYALYNNVESNELTVTATSSTSPPPSGQCSGNSGCPAESNCINGVCTPLEATDISMPDTATITGYIQYDYQSYDLVPKTSKAFTRSSYIPQCAASIDANSGLLVFRIGVNGKVLSGTAGINQAPITISSVSGGSAWSGPYKSSGTVALDVSYGDADSNGNFTLILELEMRISVGPQVS
uniref:hypothetical protein n=1 Tax=Ferrimicrobium sp. TaxID=2926050 RepID=UPI0026329CC1